MSSWTPPPYRYKIDWSNCGLTVSIWDWLLSLEDERRLIWNYAPPTSKWMYFVARYFGLLTQLADEAIVVVQAEMTHGRGFCNVWVCFEIFVLRIFVSVSEAVMMMRVYAFYNKSPSIKRFLIGWSIMEFGMDGYFLYHNLTRVEFDDHCGVKETPLGCIGFVVIVIITQIMLICMIIYRQRTILPRNWKDIPIVYIVVRDGGLLCCATCVLFAVAVPYTIKAKQGLVVFPVMNAVYSLVICRMIINLQALSANRVEEGITSELPGSETTGVVLTTRFATSDHEMYETVDFTTRFSPSNLSQSDILSESDLASEE